MKIIFHLGTHKTGTTYIQDTFDENVELLRENNVRYFTLHKEMKFLHKAFYPEAYGASSSKESKKEAVDQFYAILSSTSYDTYIISGEDMSGYIWDWTERLHLLKDIVQKCSAYDVEVVVYFRNQVSSCISIYQELVKGNKFLFNFNDFISDDSFSIFSGGLDWYKRAVQIEKIVCPKKLTVKCFETAVSKNLLTDFINSVGINSGLELKESGATNKSVNINQLDEMLKCNRKYQGDVLRIKKNEILNSNMKGGSVSTLLSEQKKRALLSYYYESNLMLFENYIREPINDTWVISDYF